MGISSSKSRCHTKVVPLLLKNTPLHTYVWATRMQWLSSGTSATCMIIGELAHIWGRMDGHHFDQQQERGCTTKVDYFCLFYDPSW